MKISVPVYKKKYKKNNFVTSFSFFRERYIEEKKKEREGYI